MGDLAAQKKLWGHDGRGIVGATSNYASRVGIIVAAGILIVVSGAFALLTGDNSQSTAATQYITDVTKDELMQSQLDLSLRDRPAASLTIVDELVHTLQKEDRRLLTQHWPTRVRTDIDALVTANQHQISVLNKYGPASLSQRTILLTQENNDAYNADFYDTQIRAALDAHPVVT
jgi:hypothetical protein